MFNPDALFVLEENGKIIVPVDLLSPHSPDTVAVKKYELRRSDATPPSLDISDDCYKCNIGTTIAWVRADDVAEIIDLREYS